MNKYLMIALAAAIGSIIGVAIAGNHAGSTVAAPVSDETV